MWCFVNTLLVAYWAPLNCSIVCCTLPCHGSLNRTCIILVCASWHVYACVFTMLVASFRFASLVSFGFVPELWGFVRLRPLVFFMDLFFFLAGSQARWPYPRNHFYLCVLDAFSFAMPMLRYLPLAYHASHIFNQASNPPCPRKPLLGYVTALLNPSYSVVSCRWRSKFVPCWNMEMLFLVGTCLLVGISHYILFN